MDTSLAEELRRILARHAPIKGVAITPELRITRDLGFDSMAYLQTVTDLEDRLGIRLPYEAIDAMQDITFSELVGLVESELRKGGGAGPGPGTAGRAVRPGPT